MSTNDFLQIGLYIGLLLLFTVPLGRYMAKVYSGERNALTWLMQPLERGIYRVCGIDRYREQNWRAYAFALIAFNAAGLLLLYFILRVQEWLPFNPAGFAGMEPHLAFNTAVSFTTNTNWQAYGGESALSYLSQMFGLTVQNFVSAATGMAVAVAVARGLAAKGTDKIGNFYVDMTRSVLYILLPISVAGALVLVAQGMPQNLNDYVNATTVEGAQQTIAQGPVASQVAIKQLGTNGGGFFSMNSAHPYENPTPFSNLLEMFFILLIPTALVYTFGLLVKDKRHGWAIYAAMGIMFVVALGANFWAETQGNALIEPLPVVEQPGNMEGKEVRFGVVNSSIWATATTAASNGSVNSMHDSHTPIGGMVAMFNMMIGEVIFGGAGAGLYGMILYVVLTVFLAGLMVGRTPEYLGKKIESREVLYALIAFLTLPIGIVAFTAFGAVLPVSLASLQDTGPHGLSELLYAYSSGTGNNGSAFAGFGAGTPYHDTMIGIAMLLGRYGVIIPLLALAGSMATKRIAPESSATFPTRTPLFVVLLIMVVLILGGLTFFPALALGPLAEHFAMLQGTNF